MHLLVAEDNVVNQKLMTRIVLRTIGGCTLSIVNNGQECLDYLASPPEICPRPDIILMDSIMPVMDGFEATRIIRTVPPFSTDVQLRRTPIITMAPPGLPLPLRRYVQEHDGLLSKPIRVSHLKRLLLQHSRFQPQHVPGVGMVMAPVWSPVAIRAFSGPRSRL
ncbi:CheY-like superfamily [Talaromyces proteolyticus]|uniref:CheY-like superfamily n=1 Tax=Talaromyces proteolyticus TaxID=1131652 RepID=A0AAD4Q3N6_9EURO|nr:CheY-like superfamily [Talaromyces proteolyticus]KAH8705234.1 CheY-like superfamily [Talaromyces proteolyticus]